jgi:hypothetical protein
MVCSQVALYAQVVMAFLCIGLKYVMYMQFVCSNPVRYPCILTSFCEEASYAFVLIKWEENI